MSNYVRNFDVKNYWNQTTIPQLIANNISGCFFWYMSVHCYENYTELTGGLSNSLCMSGGTTWFIASTAATPRFATGWSGFASRGSKYGFLSLSSATCNYMWFTQRNFCCKFKIYTQQQSSPEKQQRNLVVVLNAANLHELSCIYGQTIQRWEAVSKYHSIIRYC